MKNKIALALALTLQTTIPALTAEINVMSGGAPKEALAVLIPAFEKLTGHHVNMTYAVISVMQQRLAAGETPDMVLMPTSVIADLARGGKLKAEGSAPFGAVKIVAIVREGTAAPDISTPQAFRDTLLKARSLVYSNPSLTPSGAHMARVIKELNIAEEVEKKVTYRPALDGGVEIVATDKAELGIYPSSEVIHVKGVTQIGALPEALQLNLVYGGAVTAANPAPEPALSFIKFLAGADNKKAWKEAGFDPS
jgi:molybdate transport system substrate-binding protein